MRSDRNILVGVLVLTAFRAVGCQYLILIWLLKIFFLIDWQIGHFYSVYDYYCYYRTGQNIGGLINEWLSRHNQNECKDATDILQQQ